MECCCLGLLLILAWGLWCLEGPGASQLCFILLTVQGLADNADPHMLEHGQALDYVERGLSSHYRSQVGLKCIFSVSTQRGAALPTGVATVAAACIRSPGHFSEHPYSHIFLIAFVTAWKFKVFTPMPVCRPSSKRKSHILNVHRDIS